MKMTINPFSPCSSYSRLESYLSDLIPQTLHSNLNPVLLTGALSMPWISYLMIMILKHFFLNNYIYLFMYLLYRVFVDGWLFSNCGKQGLLSSCSALASHFGGFSCYEARVLGRLGFSSCNVRAQFLRLLGSRAQAQ